jgi:hypothetical protein
VAFGLQVSDDGLDGGAAVQLALDDTEDAALLKQELEADSAAGERRPSKRRLSAAEDRARRVAAALAKNPNTARNPRKSVSRRVIPMRR